MVFTLVESLVPTAQDYATLPDFGCSLPSVIEDPDGLRLLLLPPADGDCIIPGYVWGKAVSLGVQYLCAQNTKDGDWWRVITKEDFVAIHSQKVRDGSFASDFAHGFDHLPTFREVIEAEQDNSLSNAKDAGRGTFCHVHTHSEFSALDGLSHISEMVAMAKADGNTALAVTDHGNVSAHPVLQAECDKQGLRAILGMEAYFVPDRFRRGIPKSKAEDGTVIEGDAHEALSEYSHITLWAQNNAGLRNLWSMSTESYRDGFYGKPRLDWDTLTRLNDGVMASTGCLRGPLAVPLRRGDKEAAQQALGRLLDIFGDRLCIEIHTNHLDDQIAINHQLVEMARTYGVRMVAAVDSHYAHKDQAEVHRAWLAVQTNKDITGESGMFGGGQNYHMHTEAETREALSYLPEDVVEECISNTMWIANSCDARIEGETTTPTYSKATPEHPDPVAYDVDRLTDLCLQSWYKTGGKTYPEQVYMDRFEREMSLLVEKNFCGYYLVVADYVGWCAAQGILTGPGRGSGSASLVAYLAGIVGIDPIENDLLFERFLTKGRTSLPDFDIDFPASKRDVLKEYVRQRWGEDRVVTIGTTLTLQSKGALNDTLRVLRPLLGDSIHYPDFQKLTKLIDAADAPLAGKHLPWDEFLVEFAEDVGPLIAKYPRVFAMAESFMGRVKSYGKHAAGVVLSTERSLMDLPLRLGDKGEMITQFDMGILEDLGHVKFDLLTLRTLDTIQDTVDLIKERRGVTIVPSEWNEEYQDPQVWEAVSDGQTMGLFQVETRAGTRLIRQYRPHSIRGLADVMTLVRPGPSRSGLTHTYLERRSGRESVSVPFSELEPILGPSEGVILYQEQIMQTFMVLAGYDENEADGVRKILGKKLVDKVESAGTEFVQRSVALGHDRKKLEILWSQMAEFAKYSFNLSHAVGYATLGIWTAWLKFHFPVEYLTATLSTVKAERIPDFITEARRMGYKIFPPDINLSKVGFTPGQEDIRYGLDAVKGIGVPTAEAIVRLQPFANLEDFRTRAVDSPDCSVNRGDLAILVSVGAFDSMESNRRGLEMSLEHVSSGAAKRCQHRDDHFRGPNDLPCRFDWANEPDPPMIGRGRGKTKVMVVKPPPKKCTVACRNYTAPPPVQIEHIDPYTPDDISRRESELLGVWLTHSPFDHVPPEELSAAASYEDVESGKLGEYVVIAVISEVKKKVDRNGNPYAFVGLTTPDGTIDTICFNSTFEKVRQDLHKDRLIASIVRKNDRGVTLEELAPLA